jgi:alginate O-acetyltransferase complex protein AlgI
VLFNSFPFIFIFLPLTFLGYEILRRWGLPRGTQIWLIAASAVFYAYWSATFLIVLFISIVANFVVGRLLQSKARRCGKGSRLLLAAGLAGNLALLGYFKYANFFLDNLDAFLGLHITLAHIALPIGISFFTFQKIAFLVDSYTNQVEPHDFIDFSLFVMFFPQLIAGPIVHFGEVLPQFAGSNKPPIVERLAIGLTVFAIGLAKKVVIADTMAIHASAVFDAAAAGHAPDLIGGWLGTLCYTLQIYFDFSGYSDMAIGLGWMFGIRLPVNFASPYKARSVSEFWKRWHITLSRFLKDYLYIPLGGNRHGHARQYANLLITMLLGGIWHGAAWTFMLWGALHGVMLALHRLWQQTAFGMRHALGPWTSRMLTFLLVVLAWVPFRAADFATTLSLYRGLFGLNGITLPDRVAHVVTAVPWLGRYINPGASTLDEPLDVAWLVLALLAAVWLLPNTHEWLGASSPGLATRGYPATYPVTSQHRFIWRADVVHSTVFAVLLFLCILKLNDVSPFIYFQF